MTWEIKKIENFNLNGLILFQENVNLEKTGVTPRFCVVGCKPIVLRSGGGR